MSILVKGMTMPKSCAACRFRTSYTESLDPFTDWCYLTGKRLGYYDNKRAKWRKERKRWCPLVEVNPCDTCEIAKYTNLEDDDTPCLDCEEDNK